MKIQLKIRRYPSFATDSRGKLGAKSIPIYLFVYSCIRFSMSRNMNLYIPTSKESMSSVCQVQNNQSTKKSERNQQFITRNTRECGPMLAKAGQNWPSMPRLIKVCRSLVNFLRIHFRCQMSWMGQKHNFTGSNECIAHVIYTYMYFAFTLDNFSKKGNEKNTQKWSFLCFFRHWKKNWFS